MIGLGLLSILIGIVLIFFPGYAADLFVVFGGVSIIILAAVVMVEGLFLDHEGVSRWGVLILGILGILLGAVIIAVPSMLVIATGVALGLFLVAFGIIEALVASMLMEDLMVRLVIAIMGVFALLLGVVIIFHPVMGIDMLVLLIGLYLIVYGMMRFAHGLNERHADQIVTVRHL